MMIEDDNDGQMIFGDLGGLKFPDICLTGEEKLRKKTSPRKLCPDRGSNLGPLRDRRACYRLIHSGGRWPGWTCSINNEPYIFATLFWTRIYKNYFMILKHCLALLFFME